MAVNTSANILHSGIKYSVWVDDFNDYVNVDPETVFFDKDLDQVFYKDIGGDIKGIFDGGSDSGKIGIADSSGKYTFYDTVQEAYNASVAGDVIMQFANILETGDVTIVPKPGVTWNGNGYSYTKNFNSANAVIQSLLPGTYYIINLKCFRISTTPNGSVLKGFRPLGQQIFYLTGSYFENQNGHGIEMYDEQITSEIHDGYASSTNASYASLQLAGTKSYNCKGIGVGAGISCSGELYNSIGISSGSVGLSLTNKAFNCIGKSSSSSGIDTSHSTTLITGCDGYSATSYGIRYIKVTEALIFVNCNAYSLGDVAIGSLGTVELANCTATSAVNVAFSGTGILTSCKLYSVGSRACSINNGKLNNCSIVSFWDNSGGHAVAISTNLNNFIIDCELRVKNASAYCIIQDNPATGPQTVNYSKNIFRGTETPIYATLTNSILNTHDNQGNIII